MIRQIAPDKLKGSFACSAQLLTGCLCHRETSSLKLAKLRGCTFVNQYVVIKYLGRGACGRVFLCMDMTDNRLYAVKVCSILTHTAKHLRSVSSHMFPAANKVRGAPMWLTPVCTADPMHAHRLKLSHMHIQHCRLDLAVSLVMA